MYYFYLFYFSKGLKYIFLQKKKENSVFCFTLLCVFLLQNSKEDILKNVGVEKNLHHLMTFIVDSNVLQNILFCVFHSRNKDCNKAGEQMMTEFLFLNEQSL